ncbi:MAG: FKBP-type peptidyl-prolyl cis-trans isomerase, partial [Ilumatobacteraceae bacterium]
MGTAKRERQKANRQLRLEELAKQARKEKSKRLGLRIAMGLGALVLLVGGIYLFGGDDSKSVSGATTTTLDPTLDPTLTTLDPNTPTTVAPPKPEVSVPAALPTELQVTTITEGTGEPAKAGDAMDVHYLGYLSADGTVFDNSYDRGSPIQLTLGAGMVIQGWDEGLIGLKTGGRYQIDIPAALAYGDAGSGDIIKPGDPISFIVDIMSITPGAPAEPTTIAAGDTTGSSIATSTS